MEAQAQRSQSDSATFFGIGAQRSGTTWLNDLLRQYPDCALPASKELHFFDSIHLPTARTLRRYSRRFQRTTDMLRDLENDVQRRLATHFAANKPVFSDGFLSELDFAKRAGRIFDLIEQLQAHDLDSYVAYMTRLRQRKHAKIVGEITPAYAMLSAAVFRTMDERFPGCRFIYILRDPVERFWSQSRHDGPKFLGVLPTDPNRAVARFLDDKEYYGRTNYKGTIERLESVVPRERIFYTFFERLTARAHIVEEIRALERFLGLAEKPAAMLEARAAKTINASQKFPLTEANRKLIRERFAPVYDFVEQKFGALPPEWLKK